MESVQGNENANYMNNFKYLYLNYSNANWIEIAYFCTAVCMR